MLNLILTCDKNYRERARELHLWVECLLCRYEDLRLDPLGIHEPRVLASELQVQ